MPEFPLDTLAAAAEQAGLALDETARQRLQIYGNLLLAWNRTMNLTAITEPRAVAEKHFLDCLLALRQDAPAPGSWVIDVGTGAGFPGVVLLIARPDLRLTLLDSLQKRVRFLDALLDALGLSAETLHGRAEEVGRDPVYRERYDLAVARAVARLPVLCEYCLPFVRVGGAFLAMKGPDGPAEAEAARSAATRLGGGAFSCRSDCLPDGDRRTFLRCEKKSQTPTQFPRSAAKMTKQPL